MNYFNALTELDTLNTTHLSEKGSQQVQDFVEFVTPLMPDIKRGEAAKAKIAEYYLERKATYTEGCNKLLEPLVGQLGVSSSYISQIKKAKEYKSGLLNEGLAQWVDEHPVSVQYHIAKSPHDKVMEAFMSGEHLSKRQAQEFTRVKTELDAASNDTVSDYKLKQDAADKLIEDTTHPYIRNKQAADAYMAATTSGSIAATMEKLSHLKTCDEQRRKQMKHLIKLAQASACSTCCL